VAAVAVLDEDGADLLFEEGDACWICSVKGCSEGEKQRAGRGEAMCGHI
jgi:hypothetical protein